MDQKSYVVMPLMRRLVRRAFATLPPGTNASSLEALLALVGELDCASEERDDDGCAEDDLCNTWWISSVKSIRSFPEDAPSWEVELKSMPRPSGVNDASLTRDAGAVDEIALATLDAAIEAAAAEVL